MGDRGQLPHPRYGVGDDLVERRLVVGQPVDEGGVGAVLQKAPHQIGEEILMAADRGIDPAGLVQPFGAGDLAVERLAHAVEPLIFEAAVGAGEHRDGRDGVGIVGGELGIEDVAALEHQPGAGEIGDVGRDLAGEQRIAVIAGILGALDLGVPIGAFHQPHRQAAAGGERQVGQPCQHRVGALRIGLHGEAEAVPAGKRGCRRQAPEQLQREVEPIGLLGIDGEPEPAGARLDGEVLDPRQQLVQDPQALLLGIARVQGGQLDRDRRAGEDVAGALVAGGGGHLIEGIAIARGIAVGIGHGHRRLAQHVVREAVAVAFQRGGDLQGLGNGAAHHELLAHDAHGLAHGLADDRLAGARYEAPEIAREIGLGVIAEIDHAAGEHQTPGGGIDEQRLGLAEVAPPVAPADLVGDELVGGVGVGDPQQRLGQAHEDDALLARQRIFLHELVDAALLVAALADRLDEFPGQPVDGFGLVLRQGGTARQLGDRRRLVGQQLAFYCLAVWKENLVHVPIPFG